MDLLAAKSSAILNAAGLRAFEIAVEDPQRRERSPKLCAKSALQIGGHSM